MIKITKDIYIDENNIEENFVLSDGPGGQHVNKTATAVQLYYDAMGSDNLPSNVKKRLKKIARNRLTKDGKILIVSKSHRSQHQNREEALYRLVKLLRKAARKPKRRCKTKPTKASKERRLKNKKHRGRLKKQRSFNKRDIH
ncbi:MAG: alternative ribosome rescue aminoacyl-tRNA hydrolase ArfB [Candidatus Zixiibacteriota bacterium]